MKVKDTMSGNSKIFNKEKFSSLVSRTSPWLKEAKWRHRNEWWLKYWKRIQVKYYVLKRKWKKSEKIL